MIHPCIRSGWFNSFAGVVKRRFASYVKLNLTSGDKQQEKDTSSSNDRRLSPNPNGYGTSGSQLPVSSMIYPPSPHILSNDRRHHRSPDPPPRFFFLFKLLKVIRFLKMYVVCIGTIVVNHP